MIPKIHLAQQFGKDLVKQLSIYVLVYLKLWFEKNEKPNFENSVKISDISENRIFFRDNFLGAALAQLYMNSKNLRRRKIERFTLAKINFQQHSCNNCISWQKLYKVNKFKIKRTYLNDFSSISCCLLCIFFLFYILYLNTSLKS
jgi:hypothetical protein